MSTDYQKINTLFKRDEKNVIIPTEMTLPEFEYLKDCKWECTEKIDGTNIHCDVLYNELGELNISIRGRTAKAEIPEHLYKKLASIFTEEAIRAVFKDQFEKSREEGTAFRASIYGEGYGMKVQKGGNYIKNDTNFILFDIKVDKWWLTREVCDEIAGLLHVPIVPLVGYMTIPEAIDFVKKGFKSVIAENVNYDAEGLVLKTPMGLRFRNGERIITKLKTVDFAKLESRKLKS